MYACMHPPSASAASVLLLLVLKLGLFPIGIRSKGDTPRRGGATLIGPTWTVERKKKRRGIGEETCFPREKRPSLPLHTRLIFVDAPSISNRPSTHPFVPCPHCFTRWLKGVIESKKQCYLQCACSTRCKFNCVDFSIHYCIVFPSSLPSSGKYYLFKSPS